MKAGHRPMLYPSDVSKKPFEYRNSGSPCKMHMSGALVEVTERQHTYLSPLTFESIRPAFGLRHKK